MLVKAGSALTTNLNMASYEAHAVQCTQGKDQQSELNTNDCKLSLDLVKSELK